MGTDTDKRKDLQYYFQKVQQEFDHRGPVGLGRWMASRSMRKVLQTNCATWYRLDLDKIVAAPDFAVDFGFMDADEASDFFKKNHPSFPWMFISQEIEAARSAGHFFPCLKDAGKIVGYIKLGVGKVFILDFGRILNIPPTSAFIYDTFIMPSHRGRGLSTYLIAMTARFAREKGHLSLWCHIPSWNVPSISAFRRVGFEPVADVRFIRLLGREILCNQKGLLAFSIKRVPGKPSELQLKEVPAQ